MSIYEINLKNKDGMNVSLESFKDKVILVVNIPAKAGSTAQHKKLEKLYQKYKPEGLEILAIPSNEFNISLADDNFKNTFPIFETTKVKGEGQHDLYKHLTEEAPESTGQFYSLAKRAFVAHGLDQGHDNDVIWNFEKFIIGKNGNVSARFAPEIQPDDLRLIEAINREIHALA